MNKENNCIITDDEFEDCVEYSSNNEDDNINFDDLLCTSPPQTQRQLKIKSRKNHTHNKHNNNNNNDQLITNNNSSSIVSDSTKQLPQPIPIKRNTNINDPSLSVKASNRSKLISRVQSLPIFNNTGNNRLLKKYNNLNSPWGDRGIINRNSESDSVYDIDDDLINCFNEQTSHSSSKLENNDGIVDELDKRVKFYDKFSAILKLMLKPVNSFDFFRISSTDNVLTPSTPSVPTPSQSIITFIQQQKSNNNNNNNNNNNKNDTLPSYLYEYYNYYNNQRPTMEQLQAHSNENLWYDLYDFFVNYNKRAKLDDIKINLEKTRLNCVQPTINYILNLKFDFITKDMENDLNNSKLLTVSDYRRLNESPKYICKLSYLYCLIEDILNRVGYIESLYPSLKSFENSVFENQEENKKEFLQRMKSLLLWYNIMTDLMRQCDLFGRFLGFSKRDSLHKLWTWFDKNQNYSKLEYEKIQFMLMNSTLENIEPKSAPVLKHSKTSLNAFLTPQCSVNIIKSSTFETIPSQLSTPIQQQKSPKFQRQVSFELNASKPTKNLIFNSFDDSFIKNDTKVSFSRQNSTGNLLRSPLLINNNLTPLPQKLKQFFSIQSTNSSRKSNDSVPTSLYASLTNDLDDDEDEEEDNENNNNNNKEKKLEDVILNSDNINQQNELTREKIYKDFIQKRLCKQGLAETCKQIFNMIGNTLPRTRMALETQLKSTEQSKSTKSATMDFFSYHWMPLHKKCRDYIAKYNNNPNDDQIKQYSINCKQFQDLNLPTFRPLYLYLINCIIDLMNICMNMYIDIYKRAHNDNSFSFSLLSTEQLTKECRECIEHAILVRQYYHYMIYTVFTKSELEKNPIEKDLEIFDSDLKELINIYLKYVSNWINDYNINSLSLNVLEKEWNFCKNNLCYVNIGEDSYAKNFCTINCSIIDALIDYLNYIDEKYKKKLIETLNKTNNDDFKKNLFELGPSDLNETDHEEDEDIHTKCNDFKQQIRELRDRTMKALMFCRSFMNDLELAAKYEVTIPIKTFLDTLIGDYYLVNLVNESNDETNDNNNKFNKPNNSFMIFVPKEFVNDKRNILRLLYMTNARDDVGSSSTNNTNNNLTNNVNKKQSLSSTTSTPIHITNDNSNTIIESRHQQIRRFTSANVTDNTRLNQQQFIQTLSVSTYNKDTLSLSQSPLADNGIYLLYLSISTKERKNKDENVWKGLQITLKINLDIKQSLFQHASDDKISYLYLIVAQPHLLCKKKVDLKGKLRGNITLNKEKTSFHPNIAAELDELNNKILNELRNNIFSFINTLEKDTNNSFQLCLIENACRHPKKSLIKKNLLEILRVCYNYGIEFHMECVKFVTQRLQKGFSIGLAEFCKAWCKYVLEKLEEGYGRTTKPSWARKGFQLMLEVFNPQNSQHLTQHEFDGLRNCVEVCIKHVIGTRRDKPEITALTNKSRNYSCISYEKSLSFTNEQNKFSVPKFSQFSSLNSSLSNNFQYSQRILEFLQQPAIRNLAPPHKRFFAGCNDLDADRTEKLRESKLIGEVIERQENTLNLNNAKINVRRVKFRWQRGNKIGAGQSGTVYSCVNLQTGEMMAMKEIQYKPDDLQMIKSLADEIANIEGIKHENLVEFYGVELHKTEILIFMEFCGDKSTLDQISRESSGLPEELVRSYTNSLLKAVFTLHEHHIIHRDIKGANIFLKTVESKDGKVKTILKLGDFGSSIRLKGDTTTSSTSVGLFTHGFMGTLAYMAPEVMMSGGHLDGSTGYTFSADIWSVGCCVIEMFTGKRPWFPHKDETIMIKVFKNHEKPPFPQNINQEAFDFLKHCLEFDSNSRWQASDLLNHSFARIHGDTL